MNKIQLLKEICNWYNYEILINDDGRIVIDNGITEWGLNFVNKRKECGHFEYDNIDIALQDWLITLEESNKCDKEDNVNIGWSSEIIDFIKRI